MLFPKSLREIAADRSSRNPCLGLRGLGGLGGSGVLGFRGFRDLGA